MAKPRFNAFLFYLVLAVVFAAAFPKFGSDAGPLPWQTIISVATPIVFFFYGVRLDREALLRGLGNWKIHAVIQCTTFVVFPLIVLAFSFVRNIGDLEPLWIGVFYLAALPSTVSSSVVLVSIAGGNVPAAIFNASLSSMLGIVITPLWVGILGVGPGSTASADFHAVVLRLCLQVLLPVVLGFLLHRRLGAFAKAHESRLRWVDQSVILLIVFTSFSDSFFHKHFSAYPIVEIFLLGCTMLALFVLVFGLMQLVSRMLGFTREDRITVVFCGSKKSLVQGAVMAKVLFPGAALGLILLPLLLFHALQLLAGSLIAGGRILKL